jgi:Holliday junction DNA helicase RuvA
VIASLSGTVAALEGASAVIEVGGVGYSLQTSSRTSQALKLNSSVHIFTSLIVREDAFTLYGFLDKRELNTFDLLRSVTGVGPKSALAVLGSLTVDQIGDAVSKDDDSVFRAVSGIGPKTAKLIVVSLAGKIAPASGYQPFGNELNMSDVISALVGLGWPERTAKEGALQATKALGENSSQNELLKYALASLGATKSLGASDE